MKLSEGAGALRPLKKAVSYEGLQARAFFPSLCFVELAFLFLVRARLVGQGFTLCVGTRLDNLFEYKSEGAAAFRLLNSAKEIAEALAAGLFVAKSEISHRSVAQGIVDHSIYATRSSAQTTRIQLGLEAAPTGAASGSGVAGALAPAGVAGFFASSLPTMRASARNK